MRKGTRSAGLVFDPLRRNLKNLRGCVHDLEAQGVQFVLLTENMDTTLPMGEASVSALGNPGWL